MIGETCGLCHTGRMKQPSTEQIVIRQETPADYRAVFDLVSRAFGNAEHADGDEPYLVGRLRKSSAVIEELSLVAEVDGQIVGHILFTEVRAGDTVQLALAPLSVLPVRQNRGIGSLLVNAGHERGKRLGYDYSIVLGNPGYYSRFGYFPAGQIGLKAPFPVPDGCFMVHPLQGKTPVISAIVEYANAFFQKDAC